MSESDYTPEVVVAHFLAGSFVDSSYTKGLTDSGIRSGNRLYSADKDPHLRHSKEINSYCIKFIRFPQNATNRYFGKSPKKYDGIGIRAF